MKTVHLFDDIVGVAGSARQQRVYRSSRVFYSLVTKTGVKINPATVWIDAALSCIDAINSYLRLQRAKEVTRQLEVIKSSLEVQLKDKIDVLQIYIDDIYDEKSGRLEVLEHHFQKAKRESDILIDSINVGRDEILLNCRSISALRHSGVYSKELSSLIKITDELVFATLYTINVRGV